MTLYASVLSTPAVPWRVRHALEDVDLQILSQRLELGLVRAKRLEQIEPVSLGRRVIGKIHPVGNANLRLGREPSRDQQIALPSLHADRRIRFAIVVQPAAKRLQVPLVRAAYPQRRDRRHADVGRR